MHILHVVGARPNFMKAAPVLRALRAHPACRQTLVHTGQHYDANMSDVFFQQLQMPEPDVNLSVGSGSHAQQTAEIISRFEPVVIERKPDWVLVYGDVNSTCAAALVCSKLLIPVAHVEAGLRSRDRTMPEEINRIITDQLSEILFTPSPEAEINLRQEGISGGKIHFVGNVMIDTLVRLLPLAKASENLPTAERYVLVTLHRPGNVDDIPWLRKMLGCLVSVSQDVSVIFPMHPRTRQKMSEAGLQTPAANLRLTDPLPYLEFLALQKEAAAVITDSGGIQEETSFLGTPCLTVRDNTERPITITHGTNHLVGRDLGVLGSQLRKVLAVPRPLKASIPLWDGNAAERIARVLIT